MEGELVIVLAVIAILNLILFFKVWGMTNDTRRIRAFLEAQRPDLVWETNNQLGDMLEEGYKEKKEEK